MLADLKRTFAAPPAYMPRALKRSEDFWHRRQQPPVATPGLPHLLRGVAVGVKAAGVGLQHHVVSAGDPGTLHCHPERIECAPPCNVDERSMRFCGASCMSSVGRPAIVHCTNTLEQSRPCSATSSCLR